MLNGPQSVAVDSLGNVFIADTANNRVRKGNAERRDHYGGRQRQRRLLRRRRLRRSTRRWATRSPWPWIPRATCISPTAARVSASFSFRDSSPPSPAPGPTGYTGDGGIATNATLSGPSALAVNAAGSVWVADTFNNAVRLLQFTGGSSAVSAVTNGASNLSGPVAGGEVIVIYGSGLGPAQLVQYQADASGRVPTAVGGTSVYVNGVAAPMIYASADAGGGGRAVRHQRIACPVVCAVAESDVGSVQRLGGQPDSGRLHAERFGRRTGRGDQQ